MDDIRISPEEAKQLLDQGKAIFVDSRNPKAWGENDTKIPGALRIQADRIGEHFAEIPKDRLVIAYCT